MDVKVQMNKKVTFTKHEFLMVPCWKEKDRNLILLNHFESLL